MIRISISISLTRSTSNPCMNGWTLSFRHTSVVHDIIHHLQYFFSLFLQDLRDLIFLIIVISLNHFSNITNVRSKVSIELSFPL